MKYAYLVEVPIIRSWIDSSRLKCLDKLIVVIDTHGGANDFTDSRHQYIHLSFKRNEEMTELSDFALRVGQRVAPIL